MDNGVDQEIEPVNEGEPSIKLGANGPPKIARVLPSHLSRISKAMSYILRHGALRDGLKMRPDGYVRVTDLLSLPKMQRVGFVTLEKIVQTDEKGRYNLKFEPAPPGWDPEGPTGPIWWIRANQGHSMQDIEVEMTPVTDPSQCPVVVHGTNKTAWESIRKKGLSRMKRNHIHFAQGLPGTVGVVSGIRKASDVIIFIDMTKALDDGYKFYLSQNGVVLSPGNPQGIIPPQYFLRVEAAWLGIPMPGYEAPGEKPGAEALEEFDEKMERNLESMGYRVPRRYSWQDPLKEAMRDKKRK